MHLDETLGNGRWCPPVVHYWAVLQFGAQCEVSASSLVLAVLPVNHYNDNLCSCLVIVHDHVLLPRRLVQLLFLALLLPVSVGR